MQDDQGRSVQGRVERVHNGVVTGWAWRPAIADERVRVRILVNGEEVGAALAELPRPSLAEAGIGDGAHGFRFVLPPGRGPARVHALRVEIDGHALPAAAGFEVSANGAWSGTQYVVDAPSNGATPPANTPSRALVPLTRPSTLKRRLTRFSVRDAIGHAPDLAGWVRGAVVTRPWVWPAVWIGVLSVVWAYVHLVDLGSSINQDEAYSIVFYITHGPSGFLFGHYQPNDHVLYEALAWVTSGFFGETVPIFRMASVIPGTLAVAAITAWAWRRLGAWTAAAIVLLFTLAPELLAEMIQARGYGLAILAMSTLIICAAEMIEHGPRPLLTIGLGASMFVGVGTDSTIALAALGVVGALLTRRALRRPTITAAAASAVVFLIVFAPLLGQMRQAFGSDYAANRKRPDVTAPPRPAVPIDYTISGPTLLLAPMGQMLDEGKIKLECTGCVAGTKLWTFGALPLLLAVAGAVALWRRGRSGLMLVLALPVLLGFTLLAAGRIYVADRFVLFELVPLVVLVAVGAIAVAGAVARGVTAWRGSARRGLPLMGSGLFAALVLFGSYRVVHLVDSWLDRPIANYKEVARMASATGISPVITNSTRPLALTYYLAGRKLIRVTDPALLEHAVCGSGPLVFVDQVVVAKEPQLSCLAHDGAVRFLVRQATAGYWLVWVRSGTRPLAARGALTR